MSLNAARMLVRNAGMTASRMNVNSVSMRAARADAGASGEGGNFLEKLPTEYLVLGVIGMWVVGIKGAIMAFGGGDDDKKE